MHLGFPEYFVDVPLVEQNFLPVVRAAVAREVAMQEDLMYELLT